VPQQSTTSSGFGVLGFGGRLAAAAALAAALGRALADAAALAGAALAAVLGRAEADAAALAAGAVLAAALAAGAALVEAAALAGAALATGAVVAVGVPPQAARNAPMASVLVPARTWRRLRRFWSAAMLLPPDHVSRVLARHPTGERHLPIAPPWSPEQRLRIDDSPATAGARLWIVDRAGRESSRHAG
jgi:hypothetical protein